MTLVSDWLPKLVALVTMLLLARRLGAADFGHFAVALGWISYAWWAVDLGQAGYSIRTLATATSERQRTLGSEIFSLYLSLSVLASAVLVGLLLVLDGTGSPENRLLLVLVPYLVAYALFPDWWLRARGQLVALGVANWVIAVAFAAAVLLLEPGDGSAYAAAFALTPLGGAAVALVALSRQGNRPRWAGSPAAWRRHLRVSLKFSAAGAGGQVAVPLALATMTATGDPVAAGAFAIGLRVSASAANALWLLLHNALPQLLAEQRRPGARVLLLAAGLPLLGVLVAVALWQPVLGPALGPSYDGAGAYAALGALLLVVWGPKYVVEIGLITAYRDVPRIAMNTVPPLVVAAAAVSGLAPDHSWTMPAALLLGEGAAAAVGLVLLRRAERPPDVLASASPPSRARAEASP
jgi:O-antigen/teichoic acid export membrane protein